MKETVIELFTRKSSLNRSINMLYSLDIDDEEK